MATIANDGKFNWERLATEIKTLKALVGDLERLLNGEYPHQGNPEDSPVIDNWYLDPERKYTRTLSRFCRLDKPARFRDGNR